MSLRKQLEQGEWVIVAANKFWLHYVYAFSASIKAFQFGLYLLDRKKFKYFRFNHCLRVVDGKVIEMLGNGKNTHEPVQEWLSKQNRVIMVFRPYKPFRDTKTQPYDFFGIPQLVLHYMRKLLFKIGNSWNGTDGVPPKRIGYWCSEEVAEALGCEKPHHVLPCQVPFLEELEYHGTLQTFKEN